MKINHYTLQNKAQFYEKISETQFEVEMRLSCIPAKCESYCVRLDIDDTAVMIPIKFERRAYCVKNIFEDGYYESGIVFSAHINDYEFRNDIKKHNGVPTRNYFNVPVIVNLTFLPYNRHDLKELEKTEKLCEHFYNNADFGVGLDYSTQCIRLQDDPKTNRIHLFVDDE